jgi:hypothetical protein
MKEVLFVSLKDLKMVKNPKPIKMLLMQKSKKLGNHSL